MKLVRGSRLIHVSPHRTRRPGHGLIHWGGVSIPATEECQHLLIVGKTGSGKSQAISALLRTVADRQQPALIADPGDAYLSRFGDSDSRRAAASRGSGSSRVTPGMLLLSLYGSVTLMPTAFSKARANLRF
ncbi:MAG: type IV secretion system DNA-binding domain-containing protein [Bryobacteraceae bacterium]